VKAVFGGPDGCAAEPLGAQPRPPKRQQPERPRQRPRQRPRKRPLQQPQLGGSGASHVGGGNADSSGTELARFLADVLPGGERLAAVDICLEHVRLLVRQLCGDTAAVVVQGSYAQGLALRGSDLDVAVILDARPDQRQSQRGRRGGHMPRGRSRSLSNEPDDSEVCGVGTGGCDGDEAGGDGKADVVEKKRAVALLRRLADAIAGLGSNDLRVALRIFSASVPVLRLHGSGGDADSNAAKIVIDVSVGGSLTRGACDRCVHALLRQDPSGVAPALCRLVKIWAKRRQLTHTLRGGFSSFSFVLLAIFFLQNMPRSLAAPPSVKLPPHEALSRKVTLGGTEGSCSRQHDAPADRSEARLASLLRDFFSWAVEKLPEYSRHTLSVVSAKAELRKGPHLDTRSGRKPVILEVPFQPHENAARCLREAVWEGTVLPELERARQLAVAIASCRGQKKAAIVRTLFAAKGSAKDVAVVEEAETPATEGALATAAAAWSSGGGDVEDAGGLAATRGSSRRVSSSNGGAEESGASEELAPSTKRRKLSNRRRLRSDSWLDKLAALSSPPLVPQPPPAAKNAVVLSPVARPQVCAASLNRWLGLRAMLSGGSESATAA